MDVSIASPSHVPPPARDVGSAKQVLAALWRGRWITLALGVIFMVAAYLGADSMERTYTANGTLAIETQRFVIPELQGALSGETAGDPMPWVRTEMQVLRSAPLVNAVVGELNLMADPDFNPTLREPTLYDRVRKLVRSVLPQPSTPVVTPQEIDGASSERIQTVEEVIRRLAVTHDNRSLVINVNFSAADPVVAAQVLNALIQRYLATRAETRASANREANATLLERVAEVRREVEELDQNVQETRTRNNLVVLRAGSLGQQQLEELSSALTRARVERSQLEANWQRAEAMVRGGGIGAELAEVLGSQTIPRLRDREAEATRRSAELSTRLGPNHPDRRVADSELAAIRGEITAETRRITASLRSQVQAAQAREVDLARQLEDAREAASRVASVQAELQQLERDAEARRQLYHTLLERAQQTASDPRGAAQLPGARIISLAAPPPWPSSPRPLLAGGIGLIAGFACGGLLSLVRGGSPRGFATAEDLQRDSGLPVIGSVPRAAGVGGGRGRGAQAALPARVAAAPGGPEAEALRTLRTRLRFVGRAGAPRTVLFVSAAAGEGASSVAAAFARIAAIDGSRTLLVEGDLQHPTLAGMLGVTAPEGLERALEGGVSWRDTLAQDPAAPLDLLLAMRPGGPQAHGLLEGMRFENLLAEATEDYHLIVLDAPPAALASKAMPLAHRADAVVLVVEANRTRRETVHQAVERLQTAARNPLVAVLNKAG